MKIHVVSKNGCPYCEKAKQFFKEHNITYTEDIKDDYTERQNFYKEHNIENGTVPQIFVDNVRIGGYTDLINSYILDRWNSENLSFGTEDF